MAKWYETEITLDTRADDLASMLNAAGIMLVSAQIERGKWTVAITVHPAHRRDDRVNSAIGSAETINAAIVAALRSLDASSDIRIG